MGKNGIGLRAQGMGHKVEFGNRNSEVGKRTFDYGFGKKSELFSQISIVDAIPNI